MEIVVNGQKQDVAEGITVAGLLEVHHLPAVRVAVERNREIVPRRQYDTTRLAAGDQIEIVTFVGGG